MAFGSCLRGSQGYRYLHALDVFQAVLHSGRRYLWKSLFHRLSDAGLLAEDWI